MEREYGSSGEQPKREQITKTEIDANINDAWGARGLTPFHSCRSGLALPRALIEEHFMNWTKE